MTLDHICGTSDLAAIGLFARVLGRLKNEPCCVSSAEDGPDACTCWEPVYDYDQAPTIAIGLDHVETRSEMCHDCAFRPDSPERQGDPLHNYNSDDDLRGLEHFWCHQGMRKPIAYRHPYGIEITADHDAYNPPIRTISGVGVPFKADGTPGDRCAGFEAWKRIEATR